MKIVIVNTKGGASKSTVAFQIVSAYMLHRNLDFMHYEVDDENLDAETFKQSAINTEQIQIGDGVGFSNDIRKMFTTNENFVLDVGGNKTTSMFLDNLSKSRMYRKVDLYIIPSSGGSQDIKNMKKTYDMIMEIDENANVLFALSRVRNVKRINFQYRHFFRNWKNNRYVILQDSDVVDLSREMEKSIYEVVKDQGTKKSLEKEFDEALDANDNTLINELSVMLEIIDEAEEFYKKYIVNAFIELDSILCEIPQLNEGKKDISKQKNTL